MSPHWKVFHSQIKYEIEHGRRNEIHIREGNPPLPSVPPSLACPKRRNGYFLIKWTMKYDGGEPAQWFRVHLFKPKGAYDNPQFDIDSIPNPPNYGHDIVRSDTQPSRDDSSLWKDYVMNYWEYVEGAIVDQDADDTGVLAEEARTDKWTGPNELEGRKIHHMRNPFTEIVPEFPLRVSAIIHPSCTTKLLVVLEVKRKGRLRLFARPMKLDVELVSNGGCCGRCSSAIIFFYLLLMFLIYAVRAFGLLP